MRAAVVLLDVKAGLKTTGPSINGQTAVHVAQARVHLAEHGNTIRVGKKVLLQMDGRDARLEVDPTADVA